MLHCLHKPENQAGNSNDVSVLERQRARLKWQEQQPQQSCFEPNINNLLLLPPQPFPTENSGRLSHLSSLVQELAAKEDVSFLQNGWPDLAMYYPDQSQLPSARFAAGSHGLDYSLSRTSSCPPGVVGIGNIHVETVAADEKTPSSAPLEKLASPAGKESFKKRRAEKAHDSKVNNVADKTQEKRIKIDENGGESNGSEQNNNPNNNNNGETSSETSKENSKVSEVQKPDYIHVRARRGQATDSHSLAERVRREKISERMKYLQELVPGCNKITGKAGMLDEIINYVQSLQRQVEFLSMKLATVNPRLDFNIDDFFTKEVFPGCSGSLPAAGMLPELANTEYLQLNQQPIPCCGLNLVINPPDPALRRTTSAPVSVPNTFFDSYFHAHGSSSTWDVDLQTIYNPEFHQGRQSAFPLPPFTGILEANNPKMEM